jgi:LacI family transcriptional regulator
VVRGAEDVAFAHGYRLILCNTDNDHAKEIFFSMSCAPIVPPA